MNKKMFSGWKDVFLFTFKQGVGKKYQIATVIVMLLMFGISFGTNLLMAISQQKDTNISPIEKVYVINDSDLVKIDWTDSKSLDTEQFPNVSFEMTSLSEKELGESLANTEKTSVITKVTKANDKYEITIFIPSGSDVTKDDGDNFAQAVKAIVREGVIHTADINADVAVYLQSGIDTEFCVVGESAKSNLLFALTSYFPTIIMMMLYFMVIIYGQSMGQIVCVEKSSKLMESLLLMTKPYGLIFGKILATSFLAIIQMLLWIIAGVAGFFIGDGFAKNAIYAQYNNWILELFRKMASDESAKAFTVSGVVLFVIAICLAFLFYCMLSGAIASFASKAEELGSVMMFFNFFLIFGFMGSYIIPSFVGEEWIKVVIRLIPMSAAFLLPGEILLGTVKASAGVLYLFVLFVWTILTAVLAGKVYKDQVFYNGKGLAARLPWVKQKEESGDQKWEILYQAGGVIEKSQKIGYVFLALSPLGIFIMIQLFVSILLMNIKTRMDLSGIDLEQWQVKDFADYYHSIETGINPLTMMVCHLMIIATFGLWMYFIRKGIDDKQIFHVKSLLGKKLLKIVGLCLVCGVGLCFFADGVVILEYAFVPSVVQEYVEMAQTAGMGKSAFAIFAAICLAPIGEELLCRGVCLHFGKKAFGNFWFANLLQALLFGVIHMNWVQGVYAFFIGLVLGLVAERYQSLLPAMLIHFVVNFSASTWVTKVMAKLGESSMIGILLTLIPSCIIIAVLYATKEEKAV